MPRAEERATERVENSMQSYSVTDLYPGQFAEFTKTVSESDVYLFAGITGDFNPAHLNKIYAQKTFFKARIVHGMLLAGLMSAVLGTSLPGPGTVYLGQELDFKAPAYLGDTLTARVEVLDINPGGNRARLRTVCLRHDGTILADGIALVSPPKPDHC